VIGHAFCGERVLPRPGIQEGYDVPPVPFAAAPAARLNPAINRVPAAQDRVGTDHRARRPECVIVPFILNHERLDAPAGNDANLTDIVGMQAGHGYAGAIGIPTSDAIDDRSRR
jgi:hypothetical protein